MDVFDLEEVLKVSITKINKYFIFKTIETKIGQQRKNIWKPKKTC